MNGIINVIKPPGMSSNHVVTYLKKQFQIKRIGHAGTLDPGAAGILVVLCGKATRLSDYLMGQSKTYIAELCLGVQTDTLDSYGKIVQTQKPPKIFTEIEVQDVCNAFLGEITQIPPDYSAVHIDGKRAYDLARKGIQVQKPPRQVHIAQIRVVQKTEPNYFLFEVQCSKGTYVRTLLADIAQKLGCIGYTSLLIRAQSGENKIENGYSLDEITEKFQKEDLSFLIPAEQVLHKLQKVYLPEEYAFAVRNGQKVKACQPMPKNTFCLYVGDVFFGVAVYDEYLRLIVPLYAE